MKPAEGDVWAGVPIEIGGRIFHRGQLLRTER
jgi:hypothetical protein